LKDETRTQILEALQDLKADLEKKGKEEKEERDSNRREFSRTLEELTEGTRPLFDQWNQGLATSLKQLGEEIASASARLESEMKRNLQTVREEQETEKSHSAESWKAEVDQLGKGMEEIREQMKQMAGESSSLHGKTKEGIAEMKEELGAMLKFSFADLEKRVAALEARIKALEKMVFH
jgi:polyhydroxyalkanoate synthesis regulator phasin